jgi:hypothetical protein
VFDKFISFDLGLTFVIVYIERMDGPAVSLESAALRRVPGDLANSEPASTFSRSRGQAIEVSFTGITSESGFTALWRNRAFVALISVIAVLALVFLVLLGCNLVRRHRRRRDLEEEILEEEVLEEPA